MKTKSVCLLVVFSALLFGQVPPPPVATGDGTEANPFILYNSDSVRLSLDDAYSVNGIVLVRIEMQLTDVAGAVVVHQALDNAEGIAPTEGVYEVPLRAWVEALDNDTYRVRARVVDRNGNTSAWTDLYWAAKRWQDIPTPGGCRILP